LNFFKTKDKQVVIKFNTWHFLHRCLHTLAGKTPHYWTICWCGVFQQELIESISLFAARTNPDLVKIISELRANSTPSTTTTISPDDELRILLARVLVSVFYTLHGTFNTYLMRRVGEWSTDLCETTSTINDPCYENNR